MRRLSESLNNFDEEIRKVDLPGSALCSRAGDDSPDVDALGSTEELWLLIDLYLRGWTSKEIKDKVDGTTSGRPFDS
jgi:hypothetical protein